MRRFVYALEQGKAFVESGLYKRALVIGSEHITWLLDWSDRNTAVLFGDGAGAVVVEESKSPEDGEIFSFVNGLSSDKLDILEVPNFGSAMDRLIKMKQQELGGHLMDKRFLKVELEQWLQHLMKSLLNLG